MTEFTPLAGVAGGLLIALSAILLMASHGRIAGLSGIFGGLFATEHGPEVKWRFTFLVGLLAGTVLAVVTGAFDSTTISFSGGPLTIIVGGLLVGAGTAIGSGCTSGHGICGLARLSSRSLVATCVFMALAIATVFLTRHVIGG